MKKFFFIMFLSIFFPLNYIYATGEYEDKSWQDMEIIEDYFDLHFIESDYLTLEWEKPDINYNNFAYYKILHSYNDKNLFYNGECSNIGYIPDQRNTNLKEYDFENFQFNQDGNNYFRVCAIMDDGSQYCSNIVDIYSNKNDKNLSIIDEEYEKIKSDIERIINLSDETNNIEQLQKFKLNLNDILHNEGDILEESDIEIIDRILKKIDEKILDEIINKINLQKDLLNQTHDINQLQEIKSALINIREKYNYILIKHDTTLVDTPLKEIIAKIQKLEKNNKLKEIIDEIKTKEQKINETNDIDKLNNIESDLKTILEENKQIISDDYKNQISDLQEKINSKITEIRNYNLSKQNPYSERDDFINKNRDVLNDLLDNQELKKLLYGVENIKDIRNPEQISDSTFIEIEYLISYLNTYLDIIDLLADEKKLLNDYSSSNKEIKKNIIKKWRSRDDILGRLKTRFDRYGIDDNSTEYRKLQETILKIDKLIEYFYEQLDTLIENTQHGAADELIDEYNNTGFFKMMIDFFSNRFIMIGSLVLLIIIVIFATDFVRNRIFKKKLNINYKVSKLIKSQSKFRSKKIYISKLFLIYKSIIKLGYNVSPKFLANFIYTIKTRGFVILFGGNGVGKTTFVENFMKAIYGKHYDKYFQKVIIKEDIDDDKKFLGMYDRLNNNYIDPHSVTKLITRAYFDRNNPYILLLDEINLQDIEKYFPYFIDIDKILKNGESDFIKVGEISKADDEEVKQRKLLLIKEYNFIVNKKYEIYEFGYKIPSNLHIIGTVNVDKSIEPFTGKVLDRSDIIKMKYMGDKKYDNELNEISNLNIDMTNNSGNTDISDKNLIDFLNKLKLIFDFSKRLDKSIISYLIATEDINYLNIGKVINQKILPKVFGDEYREKLKKLLELCLEYNDNIDLSDTIIEINKLLEDDFLNYWKLT